MHLFLDASGDDGMSFSDTPGQGSSRAFTVAILRVEDADLSKARDVMRTVKRVANLRPRDELKYNQLRRTSRWERVKEAIMDLPAHVYIHHIQKDRVAPGEFGDVHSKQLPAFGHVFQLTNLVAANLEGVVVTIDRMKKQEELLVGSFLNLQGSTATVRFSDSKADDLLQAADIWAGFMRTGLETYFANPKTHMPCRACLHKSQPLCRYKRRHELHPTVQQITPLFRKLADNGQIAYSTGLVSNPVRFDLYMIDCLGFHRGKWTTK